MGRREWGLALVVPARAGHMVPGFSPDGNLLSSDAFLRGARVCDTSTRSLWWADRARVADGGDDGTVSLRDVTDATPPRQLPGHQGAVMIVAGALMGGGWPLSAASGGWWRALHAVGALLGAYAQPNEPFRDTLCVAGVRVESC